MSALCDCDLDTDFGESVAARDIAAFHRGGLPADHRRLLTALVADGMRVLCCYPDMPALVRASASRARRSYALIYPRSTWWMRTAAIAFDAFRPVAGQGSGPGFVHPERDVDAAVRKEGFIPIVNDSTWYWRIVLYRRVEPATAAG